MFAAIARLVVRRPWHVLAVWVVAAVAMVALAPPLSSITSTDQTDFLPGGYESVDAQRLADRAFPESSESSAVAVFTREDGEPMGLPDLQRVVGIVGELDEADIDRVVGVELPPADPADIPDSVPVVVASVALEGPSQDLETQGAVAELRETADELTEGTPISVGFTGDAAVQLDNQEAFENAERVVTIATIVLIVGLLLLIFRSPLAALLPIVSVSLVLAISTALVAAIGSAADITVGAELGSLLVVVLFGVGTDYIVFLLFRYRERLRAGDGLHEAITHAIERVGEAIASAALVVIVAFAALVLSLLGFFRTLGPGLAISVAVMLAAALTLAPAIVVLFGERMFWPSPRWRTSPRGTVFARLGQLVAARPAAVAAATGTLLLTLAAGVTQYEGDYDALGQLPDDTASAQAFQDLQSGLPAGALNPVPVYLDAGDRPVAPEEVEALAAALSEADGVSAVQPPQLSPDGTVAEVPAVLTESPFTSEALDDVEGPVRDAARAAAPPDTEVLVGGVTSALADLREANNRDLSVVFPVAGLLVALVLAFLLRSLVAPIYLMLAVVLGFLASLGATVLGYQVPTGAPGLAFAIPIVTYLFVTAIGTDYNILMITRLREEVVNGVDPRRAAAMAVEHTGPSVAAAGLILAGTFASLLLAGVGQLTQIGFAVSIGIVLAAFVMALLLVPALSALLGTRVWWPGHTAPPSDGGAADRTAPDAGDPEPERELAAAGGTR